jgi:hypothetical protein
MAKLKKEKHICNEWRLERELEAITSKFNECLSLNGKQAETINLQNKRLDLLSEENKFITDTLKSLTKVLVILFDKKDL